LVRTEFGANEGSLFTCKKNLGMDADFGYLRENLPNVQKGKDGTLWRSEADQERGPERG
jgi:hypothetical protein